MSRRDFDAALRRHYPEEFRLRGQNEPPAYRSPFPNPQLEYRYPPPPIPPPQSFLPSNGAPSRFGTDGTDATIADSFNPDLSGPLRSYLSASEALQTARDISPPPLRRSQTQTEPDTPALRTESEPTMPTQSTQIHAPQPAASAPRAASTNRELKQWNKQDLAKALQGMLENVRQDHARLVAQAIESTQPTEWRTRQGVDLFAGLGDGPVVAVKGETMRVKFKQHLKARKDQREEHHKIIIINTNKERVPRYRFHHVEITKNVLTPNTMLTFVPHLRDLESSEETKYNRWLEELEDIDQKSGFKPVNREEKVILTIQTERAATVSLYLDSWLRELRIPNCTKAALIAHMASAEPDESIAPQKKTDLIRSSRDSNGNLTSLDSRKAAALFTDAFYLAFEYDLPLASKIQLRRILLLDETVDGVLDPKPVAKESTLSQEGDEDEVAESNLASYSILGCLICFSHSCDHGEYDIKNLKRTFSVSSVIPLAELLRQKRQRSRSDSGNDMRDVPTCRRECYLLSAPANQMRESKPWTEEETVVLRSIFLTLRQSQLQRDPICFAADILDRECIDVFTKFEALSIVVPEVPRLEPLRVKSLSWYDNRKKVLIGDWQDHTITHEHQRREIIEPCSHEGVCSLQNCSCVKAGILCEKWCRCTASTCAYKFTGCACHSAGKSCHSKQKDRPCVCVQLNRECDPELCVTCGALDQADPAHAKSSPLHEFGCQNCELQRGLSKNLVLGQSQLDGVGYGLFTAESIPQDDFVIEYMGELITHDEGVRREARRGDVFDEDSNISYVFTLLENEGIWVDAAMYGNLSRYINHASEQDRTGSNITPRILYVNGEYRIKFTAMRDITAGEELFFNYGENFPNLTKKLLDTKAGGKPEVQRKPGRPPQSGSTSTRVARKGSKQEQKKPIRRRRRQIISNDDDDDDDDGVGQTRQAQISPLNDATKRKRDTGRDSSDEDDRPLQDNTGGRFWQESTAEDDDDIGEESTPTGGVRTRRSLRARTSETPTKAADKSKVTGRRGGARPGSGRPRKHPRTVPKQAAGTRFARDEQRTPTKGASRQLTTSESPRAAQYRPNGRTEPAEIQDSDEWLTANEEERDRGRNGQGEEDDDEEQGEYERQEGQAGKGDEGEEDEAEGEEEEDDEDVVVRKRMDRAARNRRPPAKFRGDDF